MFRIMHSLRFGAPVVLALAYIVAPISASAQTGTVDFTSTLQHVEGFGFSDAFGEANALKSLPAAKQAQVLDLLYSTRVGAGFSMYRIGIDTDSLIEPTSPGSPSVTPHYVFDGSDKGQVWLAQQGQKYGVNTFYADAWSAPAFMKTNNNINNGGSLCGSPGATTCATGDWRQAYANLLVQFVSFYNGVNVPIRNLGFMNEPDISATYASMNFTPAQAVDFIKILGPTVQSSGLPIRILCCDNSKWTLAPPFVAAIVSDPTASSFVYAHSSHEYGGHASSPLATTKPVWMTEWSSSNGTFESRWDCNNCSGGPDGMFLANDIIQAFNAGNVNAYYYWWGTSTGAAALILTSGSGGGTFTVAGRFYAIGSISRFVRPDAHVVSSTNTNPSLNAVAFRNADGSKVMAIINTATTALPSSFAVDGGTANSAVKTYLTDATHSVTETDTAAVVGTTLSVTFPPRSLTTIVLPPAAIAGSINLVTTATLQKLGDGSFQAAVKIANNGTGTAQNVELNTALLGSATGAPAPGAALPQTVGSIAPGGFLIVPLNFPSSAGTSGSSTTDHFTGAYTGGTFGGGSRIVLP
jgi:glucuronoarabinoxylan endo-1,4-beta-xylanase